MDLLEVGGRGRGWMVRAGLALLLLGGVYLLYSMYQEETTLQREMDGASSRLKATQTELASWRDEVDRLEAEMSDLRDRLQALLSLYQQPRSGRWQAALAAVERLQSNGVQFQSLQGEADGELTLVATAEEQPLARLQGRLQEADQPFELQGVQWGLDEEALTLTATLRVKASP